MARYDYPRRSTRNFLSFLAAVILLLATALPSAASTISVEPNFVDFGRVAIGDSSSQTIAVVNIGDGLLSITQIEFTFNQFDSFTWNGNIVDPDEAVLTRFDIEPALKRFQFGKGLPDRLVRDARGLRNRSSRCCQPRPERC